MGEGLKKEISDILHRALAGYLDDYKYKTNQGVFIRWGQVERDMHLAVDRHTNNPLEPTDTGGSQKPY